MTLQQFKTDFRCTIDIEQKNGKIIVVTQVIKRNNHDVVGTASAAIDIQETNAWIFDSHSLTSITPWDWKKVIDEAQRAQLDYFAQRAPIDNFFPLNSVDNPDISHMYL